MRVRRTGTPANELASGLPPIATTNRPKVVRDISTAIKGAVSRLSNPNGINEYFVEIHRLENVADDIYFRAMGKLFKNATDPIEVIKWKEFLEILENATDRAESVANIIESIVLKHN